MSDPISIYTDTDAIANGQLKNLSPILSSYWYGLSKEDILRGAGGPQTGLIVTKTPHDADFFALPMHWSYYLWNGKANIGEAMRLSDLAARHNKQVIVWHKGDLAPLIPFENSLLFAPGLNRSHFTASQRACPVFIDDPLPLYGHGRKPYRNKASKPSVGFCGFAAMGAIKTLWSFVQGIRFNCESQLGLNGYSTESIIPATFLRAKALDQLSKHPAIETNFVIRDRYTGPSAVSETEQVFYNNILDTDYTLCVRGNGNWSYRFYQTLACGRIPIFVDTDCVLPQSSQIDWKKYCVWVDRSELNHVSELLLDFHRSRSERDFADLQRSCRALWEEQFSLNRFTKNFKDYLVDDEGQLIKQEGSALN